MKKMTGIEQRVPGRRKGGFSVVELIIALGIAAIAALGIYSVFVTQQKESTSQRTYSDLQNNLRFAMDYMKGELLLAGFNAIDNPVAPILDAQANSIAFEYYNENLDLTKRILTTYGGSPTGLNPGDYTNHIKVTYSLSTAGTVRDLIRKEEVWHSATSTYVDAIPPGTTLNEQVLARDVLQAGDGGLVFTYRGNDNAPWSVGGNKADIRTIRLQLKGRSHRPDPYTGDYRTMKVTGEIKSRNLAIAENPNDTTAPPVPSGLAVRDPGECGRLLLQWNGVAESDLKGYIIYYGLSPGAYAGKKNVTRSPSGSVESLTLTNLTSYGATYYIAIRAYDNSANMSPLSAEVSGDPSPDKRSFGEVGNDSTIDPDVPLPPDNFLAATPVDGRIDLTWDVSVTPGVVGYRLYRATQSNYSDEVLLASEALLDAAATSYSDTSSVTNVLNGCESYHYRIAALHCDSTVFTGGSYADTDYAIVDSAPTDTVPPATPNLVARAGYRRVILNIQNPSRSPSADPDFTFTEVFFNSSAYPAITGMDAQNHPVVSGTLIPDDPNGAGGGIITAQGSVPAINFDSETVEYPLSPALSETSDYYFLAIAYDTCGNHSEVTDLAKDLGVQCGDCDPAIDPVCDEVPLAQLPTAAAVEGCSDTMDFSWTAPNDTTYYDHAGFHVFRREGDFWSTSNPATEVKLTGANATWFSNWQDSVYSSPPMEMGKKYSYKVCSVDCYYDQHWWKGPADWPDPGDDPTDNINCITIDDGNPSPALNAPYLVRFDESAVRTSPITGDLADEFPDVDQDFRHNTVTLFVDNLAAGTVTKQALQLNWNSIDHFLAGAWVGDGMSTTREVVYDPASQSPVASGSSITFTPPKAVDGLDDAVPLTLRFTNPDGTVDKGVDMRQEFFTATLECRNDSTLTSPCNQYGNFFTPNGPVIFGALQDRPDNPTVAWAVPGDSGVNGMDNVIVPADVAVTVRAIILDTFPSPGIAQVRLFYYIDAGAILSNPPASSDFTIANSIVMNNIAGTFYETATTLPIANNSNVWYMILAADNNGNFDRAPEIDSGAFQYYQQPANTCDDIPNPPVVSGGATASDVTLTWTAPALNTNGAAFTDGGGYNVYRNDGGGWALIGTAIAAATSYVDTPPAGTIATENYSYYVTAFDTCPAPGPNESDPSAIYTECEGAPDCIFNVITSSGPPIEPGDSLTVDLTVCSKINSVPNDIVYMQICSDNGGTVVGPDADPIQLIETGDTGQFQINSAFYGGRTAVQTNDSPNYPPAGPGRTDLDLEVSDAGDIVTIGAWSDVAYSDATCAKGTFSCDEQSLTVNPLTPDPCASPATPSVPSSLVVNNAGSNCSSSRVVTLDWTASVTGPVTGYVIYQCGDAACSTRAPLATTTGTTWPASGDYNVGSKLKDGVFTFTVEAENDSCVSDVKTSGIALPAIDPCP